MLDDIMAICQRFDDSITMEPNTGCWLWMGSFNASEFGYLRARMSWKGRVFKATRFSFGRFNGPIPEKAIICHKCDVSLCVNPAHLYAGTPLSNSLDAIERGRHPASKLSAEKVRAIRADKRSRTIVAKEYGIQKTTLGQILNRKIWWHLA